MSCSLRDQMAEYLQGWRGDLSPAWSHFLDGAEPDLDAIAPALKADPACPVIPGRRAAPHADAPPGAHVFRAFDGIAPADVSVVVLGQDPYPKMARATGRAFEDGALADWNGKVAVSLKSLLQSALALRMDRPEWALGKSGWSHVKAELDRGDIALEPPGTWFDRLQREHGVLFVNAGLTLTRYVQGGSVEQKAHIAMWRPVMMRLLGGLARRETGSVVYLLLGDFAQTLFEGTGIEARARHAGVWGTQAAKVVHPHPAAFTYFSRGNPLAEVDRALAAMSAPSVQW